MEVSHKVLAQCQCEKPSFQDFIRNRWIGIIQVPFAKVEKLFLPMWQYAVWQNFDGTHITWLASDELALYSANPAR